MALNCYFKVTDAKQPDSQVHSQLNSNALLCIKLEQFHTLLEVIEHAAMGQPVAKGIAMGRPVARGSYGTACS